ncbi:MAG: hypothetical protein R3A44_43225 [Caldilineaceae bacterium]
MTTQTQTGSTDFKFDILSFESLEDAPDGGSQYIVDTGESFRLRLRFTGSGVMWDNLEGLGLHYHVKFYADGIGIPDELILGEVFAELDPSGATTIYEPELRVSIAKEGVYKCAATVFFFTATHGPFHGLLGFTDDLVVFVHEHEEPK